MKPSLPKNDSYERTGIRKTMILIKELPPNIKLYAFHGVHFDGSKSKGKKGTEWKGICPFCDANGFSANENEPLFKCWKCGLGGNHHSFLTMLLNNSFHESQDYSQIDRPGISAETFKRFQLCRSVGTGEWLIPSYNLEGKLHNLYQVQKNYEVWGSPSPFEHSLILSTPTIKTFRESKTIWICEGFWDMLAFFERLSKISYADRSNRNGGYCRTRALAASLVYDEGICCVPGAGQFKDVDRFMKPLLNAEQIFICFDADQPGRDGAEKTAGVIRSRLNAKVTIVDW